MRQVARMTAVTVVATALAATGMAQMRPMPKDFVVTPSERSNAIDGTIARLNEHYIFPDVARKMEQSVRAKQKRGEYDGISSAIQLARQLTADFRAISNDKHLSVFSSEQPLSDEDPSTAISDEMRTRMREEMARENFGFRKVEQLRGNVGYLDLREFVPLDFGAPTATAAMTFLANADALIIDLRHNGGGEPDMVAFLSSYLFDQPMHLNTIHGRTAEKTQQWWTSHVSGPRFGQKKPLFVLTSNFSFSAAEEFSYNLKQLGRATIIGETTGGGANPVTLFKASDHFEIAVPYERAINPITRTNWEGTGVEPDVAVKADDAFDTAYRLALEKVIDTTRQPQRKQSLQKLLQETSAK